MKTVRLYSKEGCQPCEEAKAILVAAAAQMPFEVKIVDIEKDPVLDKLFGEHVPVADFGDETRLYWPFALDDVLETLNGTPKSSQEMGTAQATTSPAVTGRTRDLVIIVDKFIYQLAKHWILFIGFFLALYVVLPILAPVLMAGGRTGSANLIYSGYRIACHQLPSRSYFIFGHQMAFCHRDTAIYASILVALIVFAFVRHRVKPLSWKIYILFLIPMALDGGTQILGLRTSNWQLRTLTGVLFGLGSAWLALPYLEEAFQDIRQSVNRQLHLE
jgi:uncharacterized membrane protein